MPLRAAAVLWCAVILGPLGTPALPAEQPTLGQVLDRAGARVAAYLRELPSVVATEHMTQRVEPPRGGQADILTRRWTAELAWVALDEEPEAIGVRDVVEVDGAPVGDGRSRLVALLHGPGRGTWAEARAILDEGARHNLVEGSRNFNLPTVALFFLHPERRPRFSWKARGGLRPNAGLIEIEYRERSRPTIIRGPRRQQVYARGRVWLEPGGLVRRTELRLEIERVRYTLETSFERVATLDLVLPARLTERYAAPDGVVVSTAVYSDYRRFQTGARLVQ